MAALKIRGLDPKVHRALKERAAQQGVSMDELARRILTRSVMGDEPDDLATCFLERFGPEHGVELEIPERTEMPREITFKS